MTASEWKNANLPMIWNIYAGDPGYDADAELDLATTAPDGVYDVDAEGWHQHPALGTVSKRVRIHGIEVRKGEFVPEATARACYAAQALADGCSAQNVVAGTAEIDHVFIEELDYDPDSIRFRLRTGS